MFHIIFQLCMTHLPLRAFGAQGVRRAAQAVRSGSDRSGQVPASTGAVSYGLLVGLNGPRF